MRMGVVITLLVVVCVAWIVLWVSRRGSEHGEGREVATPPRPVVEVTAPNASGQHPALETGSAEQEERTLRRVLQELTGEFLVDMGCSQDGRYLAGSSGGFHGPGPLALVDLRERRKLFATKLHRPHAPSVSNTGVVLVQSWGTSKKLASDVCAFTLAGKPLWVFRMKANVDRSGISPAGTLAFCTTYASPEDRDFSRRLFLLDGVTGVVLWARDLDEGLELRFDNEELVAKVVSGEGAGFAFRYGEGGAVTDATERVLLLREVAWLGADRALGPRVREALQALPPQLEEAERLLGLVSLSGLEAVPRAKLLRLRGEVHEARGDLPAAVAAYWEALELYPRVGVKGRMQALERLLR